MDGHGEEAIKIVWEKILAEKFEQLLGKIPIFLREIARGKISKKIESTLRSENRLEVTEKDLVDAFFSETPFGFHGPMKSDMEEFGIDYKKYGHGDNPFFIKYNNKK